MFSKNIIELSIRRSLRNKEFLFTLFFISIVLSFLIGLMFGLQNQDYDFIKIIELGKNSNLSSYQSACLMTMQLSILLTSSYTFKNCFYLKKQIGQRCFCSPIKASTLIINEFIGSFLISIFLSMVIFIADCLIFKLSFNISNILILIYTIIMLNLFSSILGLFAMSISASEKSGDGIITIITLAITYGSGILFNFKLKFMDFFPVKWSNDIFNTICEKSLVPSDYLIKFGVLTAIYTIVAMVIVILSFRREEVFKK